MFPIRDTIPSRNHPVVTYAVIGVNIAVYLLQAGLGPEAQRFVFTYGLVPARYTLPEVGLLFSPEQQVVSLLSFMFLHGGFLHLLGNMWSLYIFGDNVEDYLGHVRFLVFYLLCGWLSGMSHMMFNLQSTAPLIGASGAIAGVMGAYFILYPASRILTVIPVLIFPIFLELPAVAFMGIWLVIQILNAAGGGAGHVAWWAHIGGFGFGILILAIFQKLPGTGMLAPAQKATTRKTSYRLQVIRPIGPMDQPNLYGTLIITPYEALTGARKMVNIPWGFHNRLFRVVVPPGVADGKMIRLSGLGRQMGHGSRGDLLLKIVIQS